MRAVVLAGGLGTRLRPAVPDLPKPMAPVAGRPFLEWVLEPLARAGFERVVLAVGYRHEMVSAHFGNRWRGLTLAYSVEPQALGTGGALRLAAGRSPGRPLMVLNGDTFLEMDAAAMWRRHEAAGAQVTLAVRQVADTARYGALEVHDGRVTAFAPRGRGGPGLASAGALVLSPAALDAMPRRGAFSLEADFMAPRVQALQPLAHTVEGRFVDIGVPEDYALAQRLVPAAAGR